MPIILVAHSFGGFVVQELIQHAFKRATEGSSIHKFLTNLSGIFFYATPFQALLEKTYDHFFPKSIGPGYSSFVDLLQEHNKNLARNQDQFGKNLQAIARKYRGEKPIRVKTIFELNETTVGDWTDMIVLEASARTPVPGESGSLPANHFTICKPAVLPGGFTDDRYLLLRNFIEDVLSKNINNASSSGSHVV